MNSKSALQCSRMLGISLLGACLLWGNKVSADTKLAQALFEKGVDLMNQKKFAEACPKLEESLRQDFSGGALLQLGICHARQGKIATAWAELLKAGSQAKNDHRVDRQKTAHDE